MSSRKRNMAKTTEDFVEEAQQEHGTYYDYSKVDYKNSYTGVIINCPKEGHGDFNQKPSCHLMGSGCPVCANDGKKTGGGRYR